MNVQATNSTGSATTAGTSAEPSSATSSAVKPKVFPFDDIPQTSAEANKAKVKSNVTWDRTGTSAGTAEPALDVNGKADWAHYTGEIGCLTRFTIRPRQPDDPVGLDFNVNLEGLPFTPKKVSVEIVPADEDWYKNFYRQIEGKAWIKIKHKKFECLICSKIFSQLKSLEYHLNDHFNFTPFKCPVPGCDVSFPGKRMSRHPHIKK